jgi:phenylpropionate dioxygenase-like ring-hydroxylating dioxygenase large terminal subunit
MSQLHSIAAFPINCWIVAAASPSLHTEPLGVTICGKPIVLFRDAAGQVAALEDRCVHRAAPLSLGRVEDGRLRCLYHGMLFDSRGTCAEVPGQRSVPASACVRSYPVLERNGWIWVWPGKRGQADEALLPDAMAADHPGWITAQSCMDFHAHYSLLIDNLLDFSHLAFVHEKSFKADPKWATIRPTISPIPRGLRVSRWIVDAPALASAREWAGRQADTWQSYDFLAPGVLLMETCYCRPGSAEAAAFGAPTEGIMVRNRAYQAVTPMTARSSRYFFVTVLPADEVDRDTCERVLAVSVQAFLEDKAMIEAQQRRMDDDPTWKPLALQGDRGIWQFHNILAEFRDGESASIS